LTDQISSFRIAAAMKQSELGNIVANGRATTEQWAAYWSAYAEDVERQRREKEWHERDLAEKQVQQEPFEETHLLKSTTPADPVQTPPKNHASVAGAAGIGLGSAIAIVLSFQLNHSILWAIVHGILSWFYVAFRAWQGNY
jgi:hypothetical protein